MPKAAAGRAPLTRDQIVEAALGLLDEGGVSALSMRRVAAQLGVEAMSLYNHVRDKQDLLEGVVNAVVATIPAPAPDLPWRDRVEALVMGFYAALLTRPQLLMVLAREQIQLREPAVLALLESAAGALADSGLSPARQVSAFRGMIAVCFGFVLTHTQGLSATKMEAEAVWRQWDSTQWADSAFPNLAKLAPQFLMTHADDDLRFTLKTFLDALESGRD